MGQQLGHPPPSVTAGMTVDRVARVGSQSRLLGQAWPCRQLPVGALLSGPQGSLGSRGHHRLALSHPQEGSRLPPSRKSCPSGEGCELLRPWCWPQPPEHPPHQAKARGRLTSLRSTWARGFGEGRGWGCLVGAGRWLSGHAATPGSLAGDTTGTAAAPNASGAAAGPQRHSRAQGLAPGDPSGRVGTWGRGWSPAVPLQVSVTPASPQRQGAGPVLCWGPPYLGTAAWPAGSLRLCGRGRQRAGARRPAAPAGEEGSGGRAQGGCMRARPVSLRLALGVCVVLGTYGRPGSPG